MDMDASLAVLFLKMFNKYELVFEEVLFINYQLSTINESFL